MEKIKIEANEYELVVNGITESDKSRTFTVKSDADYTEIEEVFSDISNIQCVSESGEVLAGYYDGVGLKSITRDYEAGTYTVVVSTDAMTAELKLIKEMLEARE